MLAPLRIPKERWWTRWLVLQSWSRLHRMAQIDVDKVVECDGPVSGTAVCGATGTWTIPGFLSRLDLPRCAKCCRGTGLMPGNGAPYNCGVDDEGAGDA